MSVYDQNEVFRSYLGSTNEKDLFVAEFARRFQRGSVAPVTIADFGCHDGALTLKLLDAVKDMLPAESRLICIDPSADAIAVFRKRKLPRNLNFEFHVGRVEDSPRIIQSCDWSLMSHCLYWSRDLDKAISPLLSVSKQACIVLRGSRGIYQIQKGLRHLLGNSEEQLYVADDVERALRRLQVSFERQDVSASIKLPDADDPAWDTLMAFFLQRSGSIRDSVERREMREFMRSMNNPLVHDISFFWMGKS